MAKCSVKLGVVSVEFTLDELLGSFNKIKGLIRSKDKFDFKLLPGSTEHYIIKALENAASLLINDRIDVDPGKGGWAKSDKVYTSKLYGKDTALNSADSVMSSVIAVIALKKCRRIFRHLKGNEAVDLATKIDEIVRDFDSYLYSRWNPKYGFGLTWASREGAKDSVQPSYRHTAWFLLYWIEMQKYDEIAITSKYLIENYEGTKWTEEKVATDVATYVALRKLLDNPVEHLKYNKSQVHGINKSLEISILDKYVSDIGGWNAQHLMAKNNELRTASRQSYTLFVLAELFPLLMQESELYDALKIALEHTLTGEWKAKDGELGFSEIPSGESVFDISCLGASALFRKPNRDKNETKYLSNSMGYVIKALAENDECIKEAYLWPLCYVVQDICSRIL